MGGVSDGDVNAWLAEPHQTGRKCHVDHCSDGELFSAQHEHPVRASLQLRTDLRIHQRQTAVIRTVTTEECRDRTPACPCDAVTGT